VCVLKLFRFRRTGRADLAGLNRLMSKVRRGRFLVQPETMLRWHRDLGRRWAFLRTGGRASRLFQRERSSW
jgi:hypothetical protein